MREEFMAAASLRALAGAWKRVLACVALSVLVALGLSLVSQREYQANVLLVIQLPPSAQPFPTAMNPTYFEYLRGFEQFLTSDALVARVIRDSQLDRPPYKYSVAAFRRSAARAVVLKNTRMAKLTVELPDAVLAHDVALRWAAAAREANEKISNGETEGHQARIGQELHETRARVSALAAEREKFNRESRVDELERQATQEDGQRAEFSDELARLRGDLAEKEAELAALASGARPAPDALRDKVETARAHVQGLRARREMLESQLAALDARAAPRAAKLAVLEMQREALDRDYRLASGALDTLAARANEAAILAPRYEAIQVADPGEVPSSPVRPRPVMNMVLAAVLGLLGSVLYETWMLNARAGRLEFGGRHAETPRTQRRPGSAVAAPLR